MRLLLCNNRYFRSSGPETYLFGLQAELERRGHDVHVFAARLPDNAPAPDADLFVEPFGGSGKYLYRDYVEELSLARKVAAGLETIYSRRARQSFAALLDRTRPDVVYTLNITNILTPSIVYEAHRRGISVVSFVCDYGLTCAAYGYFRDGHACFDCRDTLLPALLHRCVQGSLPVTGLRVAAIQLQRLLGYAQRIRAFVAPSRFMVADLCRQGIPPAKVQFLPTPVWNVDELAAMRPDVRSSLPTVAYIGRVSPEKGLPFLLRAWPRISHQARLLVIGEQHGREPSLEREVPGVEVLGPRYGQELYRLVSSVDIVVVPSLSPDNAPNVVLEALALGKPVVASAVGGIPDQVDDGCAILVDPWDVPALSVALDRLLVDDGLRERMGEHGRSRVMRLFRPESHIDRLLGIFEGCLAA
jgi:glycosyltransferase involved in cell wall biosynthesis